MSAYKGPSTFRGFNSSMHDNSRMSGNSSMSDNSSMSGRSVLRGTMVAKGEDIVYGIMRSDGYVFNYVICQDGIPRVGAGCRYFTMEEAREHWTKTRGGTQLGDETMIILDALEALHKVRNGGAV